MGKEERKQSLFIIAYEGQDTADEVWHTMRDLEKDKKVDIKTSMVIYRKDNGKLKLVHKRRMNTWGGAAAGGGIALLLAGATGGGSVLAGALVGGAIGGFGHSDRTKVKKFLEDKLGTDASALAILIKDADWQAVQDATEKYGGEDLSIELTDEAAAQLAALGANEDVAEAVAEEVEVEDEVEEEE
jgi:uncharacterized membrane protein